MNEHVHTCECCGAVIPKRDPIGLTPTERRVHDFVVKHPDCTMEQILARVFINDPNGGPLPNTISVHFRRINEKLTGCRIICSHRGPGATYRLTKDPT